MQPNNNNMDIKTEHDPDFKDDQHTNPIIFVQHRPLHPQPTTTTTTTTHQPRPVQTYPQHQPPVRCCEFCGSSNTPTWRRGPAGKASLCNACGIKWRLRKRMKKGDQSPSDRAKPLYSPKKKKQQEDPNPAARRTIYKEPRIMGINLSDHAHPHIIERGRRKHYYCKYCKQTWAISHFKNSQQFGAHCSNCSRRPAGSSSPLSDNETMGDFQPTYIGAEMPYYHHSPQFDDEDEDEHYVPSYSSSYGSSYGSSFGSSGYVSPSPPASPSLPRSSAGGRSTYGGALAMAASPPSPDVVMVPSSPDADLLLNLLNVSHQMEDEDHQDVHLPLTTVRKVTANPYAQSSSSQHHAVSNPIPIPMVKIPNSLQQLATVATEDVRVNNSYFHFHNAAAASSFSSSRFSRVPRFD